MSLRTSYFTFGYDHRHALGNFVYNKDVVVEITAEDPRAVMHELFGPVWAFQYPTLEDVDLSYYPCGVKVITPDDVRRIIEERDAGIEPSGHASDRPIRTIWIDAERVGEHHHVKVHMGVQYGQQDAPTYERRQHYRNNASEAGELVLRAGEWDRFIKALAIGGFQTDLRVCWSEHTDDRRNLWNGSAILPCLMGTTIMVPWDKDEDDEETT